MFEALSSLLDAVTRRVLSYTRELIPSEKLAGAPRGPALDCARHGCARRAYAVARTLAMLRGTISDPVLAGLATALVDRRAVRPISFFERAFGGPISAVPKPNFVTKRTKFKAFFFRVL